MYISNILKEIIPKNFSLLGFAVSEQTNKQTHSLTDWCIYRVIITLSEVINGIRLDIHRYENKRRTKSKLSYQLARNYFKKALCKVTLLMRSRHHFYQQIQSTFTPMSVSVSQKVSKSPNSVITTHPKRLNCLRKFFLSSCASDKNH